MLDPSKIHSQRLRLSDLELMHKWLNTDFVLEWYGKAGCSYEQVVQKYSSSINGERPTDPFIILYEDTPIGYIQMYKIADYPDYSHYVQIDEDAGGVDLFIGDAGHIHKGLGAAILTMFLREVVFARSAVDSCLVGPEPKNKGAIRAYQKAGFKYLKTIRLPDEAEPEYLMRIAREDVVG